MDRETKAARDGRRSARRASAGAVDFVLWHVSHLEQGGDAMTLQIDEAGSKVGTDESDERVVLVDERDREIGTAGKLEAHQNGGRLHRAFSAFLFDDRGRMLLQQRAAGKYHFPLLWTNACCGHPRPKEALLDAARRRIQEELGVVVAVRPAFAFQYTAVDAQTQLIEREYDHVVVGELAAEPRPDPGEVAAIRWLNRDDLERDLARRPETYTPWFRQILPRLDEHWIGAALGPG